MKNALLLATFFLIGLNASAQDITVRLINSKSGKPLRNVPISMFFWNGPPTFRPDKIPKGQVIVDTTTDAQGRAVFHTSQPLPEYIGLSIGTAWDFAGCWKLKNSSPQTVLKSGVVADYDEAKCGKLKATASATPGELVVFERKLTLWETMRRELP